MVVMRLRREAFVGRTAAGQEFVRFRFTEDTATADDRDESKLACWALGRLADAGLLTARRCSFEASRGARTLPKSSKPK